jgi:hypothetical protein
MYLLRYTVRILEEKYLFEVNDVLSKNKILRYVSFRADEKQCKHLVILVRLVQFASLANRRSSSFFVLASLYFLEEECYASANGRTVAAIRNYNTWFF